MEFSTCSVRLCRESALHESPMTFEPVCDAHFRNDLEQSREMEFLVEKRICHFRRYKEPAQQMQKRLESDIRLIGNSFDNLTNTINKCKKQIIDMLVDFNQQLTESLSALSDMDSFEEELCAARKTNGMKDAFKLIKSMETSLKTLNLDSRLMHMDPETQKVKLVSFPDVNSRVKDLEACAQMEMTIVRKLIDSVDSADNQEVNLKLDRQVKALEVDGRPVCMTMYHETASAENAFGEVFKTSKPHSCIFVATKVLQPPNMSSARNRDSIHGSGFSNSGHFIASKKVTFEEDGAQSNFIIQRVHLDAGHAPALTIPCCWDPKEPIVDLYCDSQAKSLFIAQKHGQVTVTDTVNGDLQSQIFVSDVDPEVRRIYRIAGNPETLFVLAKLQNKQSIIFGFLKATNELQLQFPLLDPEELPLSSDSYIGMSVQDHILGIYSSAGQKLLTVCTITGQVINSEILNKHNYLLSKIQRKKDEKIGKNVGIHADALYFYNHLPVPRISTLLTYPIATGAQTLSACGDSDFCTFVIVLDEDDGLSRCRLEICKA